MSLKESELILNDDGSIYHLNLKPQQLAHTVITVGDPERVAAVSRYFDSIEIQVSKREFHTHTGIYKGKRITVISTGIGTDNIDIVFNELDALVNVDFQTRTIKKDLTTLDIIRIGTTGAVQPSIPVDSFLLSQRAIGFDSLLHWYDHDLEDQKMAQDLAKKLKLSKNVATPYLVNCNKELASQFQSIDMTNGTTITNVGFYGPQSRSIRLQPAHKDLNELMANYEFDGHKVSNLEMETAGIYAMSTMLGHRAVSLNAVLANRATGTFSTSPTQTVDRLIKFSLDAIASF
ncbi:nucleoside phosphorylase [Nonlabens ponticola]|uniref:Uridine phosphorylase n=1 Tax=Nonlabens ponticola TaxID=2496866 RepID=A0A3S9MZ03_9FLAO|nr:nucleoside phosphorylase [Nonlabens ponticola]AZQ44397.1 phosphorylase [Nonlabens ponticola]